eukprot:s7042_g2.t1
MDFNDLTGTERSPGTGIRVVTLSFLLVPVLAVAVCCNGAARIARALLLENSQGGAAVPKSSMSPSKPEWKVHCHESPDAEEAPVAAIVLVLLPSALLGPRFRAGLHVRMRETALLKPAFLTGAPDCSGTSELARRVADCVVSPGTGGGAAAGAACGVHRFR